MHGLINYICDELEALSKKAEKEGKLTMAEVQLADTLAHMKKNLLKADEMWEESEYSMADGMGGSYEGRGGSYAGRMGGSYARGGGRRGRGGRTGANQYGSYMYGGGYSRAGDVIEDLRGVMDNTQDEGMKQEINRLIQKMERM